MVFGTFDGIHKGHLDFFRQAREYGDYLIVVVGRDATVEKIKNRKPKRNEEERVGNLQKLGLLDKVLLGNSNDPYKIIKEVRPDIICLGYDQNSFSANLEQEVRNRGLSLKIIRLKPFHPEKYHSSKLDK